MSIHHSHHAHYDIYHRYRVFELEHDQKNLSGVLDGAGGKFAKKSICSRPVTFNLSVKKFKNLNDL